MTAETIQLEETEEKYRFKPSQEFLVLMVSLALIAGFSVTLDGFATVANFLTLARSVAVLGILGLGMGIVVIARGLDLSQIAILAVSSAYSLHLMQTGQPVWVGLAAGLATAILIGLANGVLVAIVEIPALFTTLAMAFFVFGASRTFLLDTTISYVPTDLEGYLWIGQGRLWEVPVPVLVFALAAVAVHVFLTQTSFGRFVYAQGDNFEAARLSGLPVRPMTILVYSISAIIAFFAGIVMSSTTASMNTQIINSTLVFDVILVVVLGGISLVGGRGSVLSVVVGTLLIGTLLNGMTIMNFDNNAQDIMKGLVLLAAILLDTWIHPRDEETARQGD